MFILGVNVSLLSKQSMDIIHYILFYWLNYTIGLIWSSKDSTALNFKQSPFSHDLAFAFIQQSKPVGTGLHSWIEIKGNYGESSHLVLSWNRKSHNPLVVINSNQIKHTKMIWLPWIRTSNLYNVCIPECSVAFLWNSKETNFNTLRGRSFHQNCDKLLWAFQTVDLLVENCVGMQTSKAHNI